MPKYAKIGTELVNLDAITHVTFLENQSGLSDRILIYIGETYVTVDSGIGGRKWMETIRRKLLETLTPEDWDSADEK